MTTFSTMPMMIAAAVAAMTLSACGGAGTDPIVDPGPSVDTPLTPTITDSRVISSETFISRIEGRTDTAFGAFLPSGSAKYSGRAVTDLSVSGQPEVDGLYGEISMTADLSGGNSLTGRITNLHTLDGAQPVERLSGAMDINGTLADFSNEVDANLTGTVTGVFGDGENSAMTVSGSMEGDLKRLQTGTDIFGFPIYDQASGMAGEMSGTMTGGGQVARFDGDWAVD